MGKVVVIVKMLTIVTVQLTLDGFVGSERLTILLQRASMVLLTGKRSWKHKLGTCVTDLDTIQGNKIKSTHIVSSISRTALDLDNLEEVELFPLSFFRRTCSHT